MAQCPRTVRVGPFDWRISFDRAELDTQEQIDKKHLYGFSQLGQLRIVIAPDKPESIQRETVLHEIMHAVFAVTDAGDSISEAEDSEEYAITHLSPGVFEVLRENPKLTKWLLSD